MKLDPLTIAYTKQHCSGSIVQHENQCLLGKKINKSNLRKAYPLFIDDFNYIVLQSARAQKFS